ALAKKPDDRYQTARALAADYMDAIGMVAEASTLRISLPGSPKPPPATASKNVNQPSIRNWMRVAVFSAIGLLLVILAAFAIPRLIASNQLPQNPGTAGSPATAS